MTTAPLAEILAARLRAFYDGQKAIRDAYAAGEADGRRLAELMADNARDADREAARANLPEGTPGHTFTPEAQAVADALSGMPRVGGEPPEPEVGMVVTIEWNYRTSRMLIADTPTTWDVLLKKPVYPGPYRPGPRLVSIEDRAGRVVWVRGATAGVVSRG